MSNDITNLLFDPDNKAPMSTGNLQFMLSSWSRRTEEPPSITDWRRFEIVCLIHSKNPEPPEHEYLIIKIKDRVHEKNHFLVLERFASPTPAPADASDKEFTEKFLQFLTTLKKSPLKLMEEGSSSRLTISNELSVSAVQSLDLFMDSMNKSGYRVALDQFVRMTYL